MCVHDLRNKLAVFGQGVRFGLKDELRWILGLQERRTKLEDDQ